MKNATILNRCQTMGKWKATTVQMQKRIFISTKDFASTDDDSVTLKVSAALSEATTLSTVKSTVK